MPASAHPTGYSLDDVASALAKFSDSGNNTQYLPNTPFQVIYIKNNNAGDPANLVFDVKTGTQFFVPVFFSDDSPPVLGNYPATKAGLADYYFSPAELGITDVEIEVDGQVTDLGPDYIGAVFNVALPNGGNNYSEIGAFLSPMNKGTHTITIRGLADGDALLAYPDFFPGGVLEFELTYTLNVH
jgi:hypothetical protein